MGCLNYLIKYVFMTPRLLSLLWIGLSIILLPAEQAFAQCATPSAIWLHTGQTSTALTFNWSTVPGATQYQIRFWEGTNPGDKTILEAFGPAPATLSGLKKATVYGVQIRTKCGNEVSAWSTAVNYLTASGSGFCTETFGVTATASGSNAVVSWLTSGAHTARYRLGTSGDWTVPAGGMAVSTVPFTIQGLQPGTYQVEVKRHCTGTSSVFVGTTVVIEQAPPPPPPPAGGCLANKNYGKNLSLLELLEIDLSFNTPSPYSFGSMIGVNDGGLVFRSFQNETTNPIARLTTEYRNFHTMDEDFDASIGNYADNIKPRQTTPEGTPSNMSRNKSYYQLYRNTHGFTRITGAVELLHYGPQSWKDKMYLESDWSASGPAGIRSSFGNYTKKFIDELAPANGNASQLLVSTFQVGNELWDYPVKADYHNLLQGAHDAFVAKYGQKSAGGWKMRFAAGAFQAYRSGNCSETLRDVSNCGGALQRHDFIGDYLDVPDCTVLKNLDIIDCHPYSFMPATTTWTYPENPSSEAWQIRNMAAWLQANRNSTTGVLNNTTLWSTEYGFDSNPTTGVGEQTQAAYLIRGLFMHSRYHFQKVFFYNAFDQVRVNDATYNSLYSSSGFWKQGTQPNNGNWPSPLPQHGATPKPSWYAMLDLKTRFGEHVFYKSLAEDSEVYAWIIAKPDGSDPYLVCWAPKQTSDANINQNIAVNRTLDWSGVLEGSYKIESGTGQTFTGDTNPGQTFAAASGTACGTTVLTAVRRNPAFIRLTACAACSNVTNAGGIIDPSPSSGQSPFNPGVIANDFPASGGTGGSIVYQWQQSTFNTNFTDIQGATSLSYDPPSMLQSAYFRRAARRSTCPDYLYSPSVLISVTSSCPTILSFRRVANTNTNCNPGSDYYYEIVLGNVTAGDQITLSGLPTNGLSTTLSSLNGIPFTTQTFFNQIQYVDASTSRWIVNASNGSTQTLRLYYCWANAYPNPVSLTTATSQCSGISKPCTGPNDFSGSGSAERNAETVAGLASEPFQFTVQPNPGNDYFLLAYQGPQTASATLQIFSVTGQLMAEYNLQQPANDAQWEIDSATFAPGMYYLTLKAGSEIKHVTWAKG